MVASEEPEQRVYDVLDRLGITYQQFHHPPVATVEDAEHAWSGIDATCCKNLFLRNKKGNRHYLVLAERRKQVDLRALVSHLEDDRLSFASPDRLLTHLRLAPGAVSPFGLINDPGHTVQVVVDSELKQAVHVAFHPNVNTATVRLHLQDFERFLEWCGHTVRWVDL